MIEEPSTLTIRKSWQRPTNAQIAAFKSVPTGFVADALGGGGALSVDIKPLNTTGELPTTMAGPAITADNAPGDILGTLAALSLMQKGDVLVAGFKAFQGCAAGGDRVMGMLKNAGGVGFVTDGPMRDYAGIIDVGLPVWCTGLNPASPFSTGPGKTGFPINIGAQSVSSGDMVVADRDGVVIVPYDKIEAVINALETIKVLEKELDAKVAEGLICPPAIEELMASEQTSYID